MEADHMKKRTVEIGAEFGHLVVIGFAGSDRCGHQLVRVRCSCRQMTEKTVRLSDLTFKPYTDKSGRLRLPYRSCGCESKYAYLDYLESISSRPMR